MPSFLTSRISTGLQSDISNAFTAGLQTGVNRATLREQTKAAEEKAAILGAAQVREAQVKAKADQMKATLDNAEKHYKQQASYYDDQNTYLQTQLLNNGSRYTDDQRQEISRQIEGNLREKARIMAEGAQIFGLPAFTPKASNVSVASQYSPEYEAAQAAEREGKKFDTAVKGLDFNIGKTVFERSGGVTRNYGDMFIPQRLDIQERSLEHNISNDPPPRAMDIFGPVGTSDLSQLREIQTQLPALISEHRQAVERFRGGQGAWERADGRPVNPDPDAIFNEEILPKYSRLAGYWKSNLDPDEAGVVTEAGITFDPTAFGSEASKLNQYVKDTSKPVSRRKAAAGLYNKLGFGSIPLK